jgi:GMP reductase
MKEILSGIDYDDILLLPKLSGVNSRSEVNVFSDFKGRTTGQNLYPIFSAPMKEISGVDLVSSLSDNHCLGILHRFFNKDYRANEIERQVSILFLENDAKDFGVAIGLNELDMAIFAQEHGATLICVDIANGYINNLFWFIDKLRQTGITIPIMTGNVVDSLAASVLVSAGANFIRVGIGSGKLCSTRDNIGIGCPQLTALDRCSEIKQGYIVSDGGISNPGRAVKSFVFGADFVMIGSLFAHANEAENKDGHFYGMASRKLQEGMYDAVKSVEGLEMYVPLTEKKPCATIVSEFISGIQSACTYLNVNNYNQLEHIESIVTIGKGTLK